MCSGMGLLDHMVALVSFPDGTSGKEHTYQCRRQKRCRFYPWLWKIPWENTISSLHISSAILFSSVRSLSPVQLFATPWTAAHQASLSITNPRSLLKLMSIDSVMPSNHLILCHPLLLPPSIFPSVRVFSNESVLFIRWPKHWSLSFSISPSNEYSELICFKLTGWISLPSKGLSRVFSNTTVQKHQFFSAQLYGPTLTYIHDYWKNNSFD